MEFLKANVDYIILGILGLMSLIMLWKVLERYIFLARVDVRDYPNIHELNIALERNMTPIYTIGSNAPYVGLLGTVTGILITFYDMGQHGGNIDAAQIMVGLALALKATALGILVAIPSVMFYNILSRKVDVRREKWLSYQKGNAL
jgi:tonB-system energizer exbB